MTPKPVAFETLFPLRHSVRLQQTSENFIGEATALVVTGDRIVVADGMQAQLLVFDLEGRYLRTLGRAGDGPGEFRRPQWITGDGQGDVFVFDPIQRRVTQLSAESGYRRSWNLPSFHEGGFERMADGTFLLGGRLVPGLKVPSVRPGDLTVHVLDENGTPLRSFLEPAPPSRIYESNLEGFVPTQVGSVIVTADRLTNRIHHQDLRDGREWWGRAGDSFYRAVAWLERKPSGGFADMTAWSDRQMWTMRPFALGPERYLLGFTDLNPERGHRDFRYVVMGLDGTTHAVTGRTERIVGCVVNGRIYATLEHEDGNVDVETYEVPR